MKVFVKYNWKFECDFEARGGQETFELSGLEPEDGMAVLCEKIEEKTTIRRGQPDGGTTVFLFAGSRSNRNTRAAIAIWASSTRDPMARSME